MSRLYLSGLILLLSGCFVLGNGSKIRAQNPAGVAWLSWKQLDSALNVAPRRTFVFFYADWCVYCKRMERTALVSPEIISTLNSDYYAVKMNAESQDTIRFDNNILINRVQDKRNAAWHDMALLLGSRDGFPFGLPVSVVLSEKFEVLRRSFVYMSPDDMKRFLD